VLPVKLLSHLTIEADIEGYSVPINVNAQPSTIEVRPDRTTITYAHIGFTRENSGAAHEAVTGPVVLFQVDSAHAVDLTFRFTPEMRWMWPKRSDGSSDGGWETLPGAAANGGSGFYAFHLDYPGLGGAVTIPTAKPGIMAPFQERPQVHPLELKVHYDPRRDGTGEQAKLFPLLMAVGTTAETSTDAALAAALVRLNAEIPAEYAAHVARYAKLEAEATSITTPDKALDEAFRWGVVSIEQLKAREYTSGKTGLVAGYFASADSARPGFGGFFGRDSLYTLYAVNGFGDFGLSRMELEFLIERQRADGKIMHEFSQTAADPAVEWKSFPYMYAAADATPLFLMAVRDYLRASGDVEFVGAHRDAIEKAWAFETAASSDADHDGIFDNSQGTGWVEGWRPNQFGPMPHQEVYLALLDEEASVAYAALETALGGKGDDATARARAIQAKIEAEYYDAAKGCYAFSHNPDGSQDGAVTVYASVGWWDEAADRARPLAHAGECLKEWAGPAVATDWGLRDVATTEPFYDGMSYHQGSVWPLFTGWGAMAELRGGQPLAGQQMLMQNADLTWAQDLGAVTELLSGDLFVPFGRSTSHQLWSSAMVITPALRGLFGVEVDAGQRTITVNPHLPADWDEARVERLHVGSDLVTLTFRREKDVLRVGAESSVAGLRLRSDAVGAVSGKGLELSIPLEPVEFVLPAHALPVAGARPEQMKVLSAEYGAHGVVLRLAGRAGSDAVLGVKRTRRVELRVHAAGAAGTAALEGAGVSAGKEPSKDRDLVSAMRLQLHFADAVAGAAPASDGWRTMDVAVDW
jgi:glycogen debranching enzyme